MDPIFEEREGKKVAVLPVDDYEKLKASFDKGFGKGIQKGREETLGKFGFLGLKPEELITEKGLSENLDTELAKIKPVFDDYAAGRLMSAEKLKDKDSALTALQQKLEERDKAFKSLEDKHEGFRKKTLVDSAIKNEAIRLKAFDPEDVTEIFKRNHQVELTEDNRLVIKNQLGNPMFNDKGEHLPLSDVFKQFAEKKAPYFQGQNTSGSGDSDGIPPSGLTLKDLKTDEEKAKFVKEHGLEAYQALVRKG